MKVPKALTFPLAIKHIHKNSIEIVDSQGNYLFEIYSCVKDLKTVDTKIAKWIVKTLNKAASDS